MFKDFNTNSINIINVFSATVNKNETGMRKYNYGETSFYQLGIKLTGKTCVSYNKKLFDYSAGSVLYLPREKSKNTEYNKIYIKQGKSICIFFNSEHELPQKAFLYNCSDKNIISLFKELLQAFQSNRILEAKSLFYKILYLLDCIEESNLKTDFSKRITNYISKNINDYDMQISDLSDLFGYSADYFRHKFRKEFNVSPKEYILSVKINTAKELLLNSNDNISLISKKCGFIDNNYFTRLFKQKTGSTPTQYRKSGKKFL